MVVNSLYKLYSFVDFLCSYSSFVISRSNPHFFVGCNNEDTFKDLAVKAARYFVDEKQVAKFVKSETNLQG
jgi:hypothetical protein